MSKPFKIFAASFKTAAFTTKTKSPSVMNVIGIDKNNKSGVSHMLKKPTTTAAHIAEPKDWILNFGTMAAVRNKQSADNTQVINNEIMAAICSVVLRYSRYFNK